LLTAAVEVLVVAGPAGQRCLPCLLDAVQRLIGGQSEDIEMEGRADVDVGDVLRMEAGKTAALLSCAASIGALAIDAPDEVVAGSRPTDFISAYAFQMVDDILASSATPQRRQVVLVGCPRREAQRTDRRGTRRRVRRLAAACRPAVRRTAHR